MTTKGVKKKIIMTKKDANATPTNLQNILRAV